ncbi:MAG: bifunctional diaminohydroxyphosphoribosylaminopyrimidine deaminase/5-amino-6-(5-phosphoribosylamino)uracil reductase RibD [Proteobacteria bacterium]|nr:bifunctional diaminohydroxyphosphoribosylaminopyrimidine deaminase/5-amino-6-(5-phosphoribosylamino)uracil reductase RibD [Pseudomonadota bacterium]
MHKNFMLAALEEALLSFDSCVPNPRVGAVAVSQGKIIAKASHKGAGTAHAEVLVLNQLPKGINDLSLYVTLEPCNHWGKTPPCTRAIIEYGVKDVFYAYKDPNPKVQEKNSSVLLERAGIKVSYYPLSAVEQFYESYAYWTQTKRPWVSAKLAQSLDAKIALKKGVPYSLSNGETAIFTHELRKKADLILTTAKTIQSDNPLLNVRLNEIIASRAIAIIDRNLVLTGQEKVFKEAKHCHIFYDENYEIKKPLANCSYHPAPTNKNYLDLDFVIKQLGEEGYHDVFVEAGGHLFASLHRENLVQRSFIYLTPHILGIDAISAFPSDFSLKKKPKLSWQLKQDDAIATIDWTEDVCSQV